MHKKRIKAHKIRSIIKDTPLELIKDQIKMHLNSEIIDIFIYSDKKIHVLDKSQEEETKNTYILINKYLELDNKSKYSNKNIINISKKTFFLKIKYSSKFTIIITVISQKENQKQEESLILKTINHIKYILKKENKINKLEKKLKNRKNHKIDIKEKSTEELKTIFLANLSHEIKTPMNSIIGFTDLLQIPNLQADKVINFASIANNNAKRLLNLLEDIIDLSKIQTNNIKLKNEEISLTNILNEIFILNNNRLIKDKSKRINFNLSLPECLRNRKIKADSIRIKQILTILLSNAINFTNEGSIIIGIRRINNNEIEFYIKDTGCGIKEKNRKIIFISFNQGGNFLKRNNEGSGLGLSIAKGLLKLYNTKLKFKSKEGIGTTFYFNFPLLEKTITSR